MATPPLSAAASATAISVEPRRTQPERSVTQRWFLGAFLLAGAAQLITVSALLSVDALAPSWWALLLAIAPVLLTAAAAFSPRSVARPAAGVAAVAMIAGIVGSLASWGSATSHTGPLFIPALVAVVVGGLRLWRANPA